MDSYRQTCNMATLQSRTEGFFKTYAEAVLDTQPLVLETFSKLKSDKERFLCCWSIPASHCVLSIQAAFKSKDPISAATKRNEALTLLEKNQEAALALLNQSVIRDLPGTPQYFFTLQCRAKVLMDTGRPDLALVDAHAALKGADQKAFVYALIGDCYLAQGLTSANKKRAELAYKIGQKLSEDLDKKSKVKANNLFKAKLIAMDDRLSAHLMLSTPDTGYGSASIPQKPTASLSRKKSDEYSGAFSGFKVKTSKDLGRYATTSVDLAAGETIVVEEPHASVLNFDKYGGYCHHCQERLVAVFSCPWCRGMGFCSEQCREAAVSSYHVYECHLTDLIYASGMSQLSALALRVVSQKNLEYFKSFGENEEKLDGSVRSYANIRNLVGHESLRDGKDMFMRTMMAVFQLRLLKFSGYFKVKQDTPAEYPEEIAGVPDLSEDELLIGTVLLRNLHVLQFNAHEVCDLAVLDGQGLMKAKSHSVGLAVYQTASLFNHSCYPNVARYFIGTKLVICTTRQVPSGAALYDNYGPLFTQKNLVQRKKLTHGRYWFDCSCEACTQDWPVLSKMKTDENQRFRCAKCGNLLSTNKSEKTTKCSRCQSENDLLAKQTAVQEATKLIKDAASKMDRHDNTGAIESLLEAIKLMESNIVPPFRDLHLAQDYLRLCYSATGSNWKTTAPKK